MLKPYTTGEGHGYYDQEKMDSQDGFFMNLIMILAVIGIAVFFGFLFAVLYVGL